MKQILFLLLLFPTIAYSQYDSTRNRQTVYAYGFNWLNGKFASSFVIPTDTAKLAVRDSCLLYTSDAADARSRVDLGGRRIIKKKNEHDR